MRLMTNMKFTDIEIIGAARIVRNCNISCTEAFSVPFNTGFYCITCRIRPAFAHCGTPELKYKYAQELLAKVPIKRLNTILLDVLL